MGSRCNIGVFCIKHDGLGGGFECFLHVYAPKSAYLAPHFVIYAQVGIDYKIQEFTIPAQKPWFAQEPCGFNDKTVYMFYLLMACALFLLTGLIGMLVCKNVEVVRPIVFGFHCFGSKIALTIIHSHAYRLGCLSPRFANYMRTRYALFRNDLWSIDRSPFENVCVLACGIQIPHLDGVLSDRRCFLQPFYQLL